MAGWIGTLFTVGSSLAQANSDKAQGEQNGALLDIQADAAGKQALSEEEAQRRSSRQQLGSLAATMAQNGNIGPQAGMIEKQSALAAELDALNIRYQGQLRKSDLTNRANAARRGGQTAANNSNLLAASSLISGYAKNYTGQGTFGLNK
jgi:hypothetical protein